MPIQNLTGDPAKQYLADGFTEVLTAHLARLPGLAVASSATMATQRGAGGGELALAEKLGVRLLLAGSVVQADDRIALSIKLTDPREGRTIWGSELEREPSTILDARSEIARLVAARLSLTFPAALRADDSRQLAAEAQDAFLRGLAAASDGSATNVLAAIGLFSRAVQLEPTWADPLAHLALVEQRAIEFGDPALRQSRAQDVRAHAMRAIELDPSVPMSYTALAAIQAYHDWDFVAAEATLRQAIDTSPVDSSAQGRLALVLAAAGRLDEAVEKRGRRAIESRWCPNVIPTWAWSVTTRETSTAPWLRWIARLRFLRITRWVITAAAGCLQRSAGTTKRSTASSRRSRSVTTPAGGQPSASPMPRPAGCESSNQCFRGCATSSSAELLSASTNTRILQRTRDGWMKRFACSTKPSIGG